MAILIFNTFKNNSGAGHFQGNGGDENLKIDFMWPDISTICDKFYILIISIDTRHETDRNEAFFKQ